MKRVFLDLGIVLISIMILMEIFYFFNGSLEAYPTEEQNEKVKIVAFIIMLISFIIDMILVRKRIIFNESR